MMQNTEKLCLKWNDFQDNLNLAFGEFRNDIDLADVTLASEDGTQIETHKMVLALSSPFFKEILKKNKHPHPLIFMRGIRAEALSAVVDFLYFGEAGVKQESLDSFFSLAEELKLKGWSNSSGSNNEEYETKPRLAENKFEQKKQQVDGFLSLSKELKLRGLTNSSGSNNEEYETKPRLTENNFGQKRQNVESTSNVRGPVVEYNLSPEPKSSSVGIVSFEAHQLDEQVKSMMTTTETTMTYGNQTRKIFACKVCGKEGDGTNIKTHIEAKHIVSDIIHSCDICGKTSRSRVGLRQHKSRDHSKLKLLQD